VDLLKEVHRHRSYLIMPDDDASERSPDLTNTTILRSKSWLTDKIKDTTQ